LKIRLPSSLQYRISIAFANVATNHRFSHPNADTQSPITISADHFQVLARQTVSQCSSQLYLLVSQPGLHVTDFSAETVPYLRKVVENAEWKVTADYGHGELDLEDISALAMQKCGSLVTFVDARRTAIYLLV